MAYDFKFPDIGEGIHEGVIVKWLVKEGDEVKEDQPLAEVETDKAVVEIPSPKPGFIIKCHGAEGETIKVGNPLVTIGAKDEKYEAPAPKQTAAPAAPQAQASTPTPASPQPQNPLSAIAQQQAPKPAAAQAGAPVTFKEGPPWVTTPATPKHASAGTSASPAQAAMHAAQPQTPAQARQQFNNTGATIMATPSIRRLARDLGVDLSRVQGTGHEGRITEEDVKGAAAGATGEGQPAAQQSTPPQHAADPTPAKPPTPVHGEIILEGPFERVKISNMRHTIAERMSKSAFTIPHVTHYDEVEVSALVQLRAKLKPQAEQKRVKLTFLPFIVKALVEALRLNPKMNAVLDHANKELVLKKYYNIGISVDTPEGLMVVVIHDADKKSIYEIAGEISKLAEEARIRKVALKDLKGSSFTITNVGSIGGILSTPIINYPETAILGVHKIADKPVVREGAVVPGKVLGLAVSFDHRIVDGADAARFLNEVMKGLSAPEELLK